MSLLLVWCVAFHPAVGLGGARDDFAKLEAEMESVAQGYYDAMRQSRAGSDGEARAAEVKLLDERRRAILDRMQELAASHAGTADGGFISGQIFLWSTGIEERRVFERFEKLAVQYPDEPSLDDALELVPSLYYRSGRSTDWIAVLERLARTTQRPRTRLAAYFTAGQLYLNIEKLSEARSAFENVIAQAPPPAAQPPGPTPPKDRVHPESEKAAHETDFATLAKGFVYEIEHLQVGMVAPDFTVRALSGKDVTLQSLRGKVVLLDFWASWCVPCLGEIPSMQAAATRFKDQSFEILAISVDRDRRALENVVAGLKVPGIHTWHEQGIENPIALLYNVRSYPTWFLLDAQGVIRKRGLKGEQLVDAVEELLRSTKVGTGEPSAGAKNDEP